MGLTGSGKTSLINLLLGFYLPSRGEIRIGGRPLAQYSLESLRKAFGVVSQDVYIFPRTIRENLFTAAVRYTPGSIGSYGRFPTKGPIRRLPKRGATSQKGKTGHRHRENDRYRPRYISSMRRRAGSTAISKKR